MRSVPGAAWPDRSKYITMSQHSVSPQTLAAELFQGKNFRFLTKAPDRQPTFYFETIDSRGRVLLGRLRQQHPSGPKVSVSIGGNRTFINPANSRDVRTAYTDGFYVYEQFPDGDTHHSGGTTERGTLDLSTKELQMLVQKLITDGKYSVHTA